MDMASMRERLMSKPTRKTKVQQKQYMLRTTVAYMAFLYEIKFDSPMPDLEWDALALKVDVTQSSGDIELDKWYKENYDPNTGSWIYSHPHKDQFEEYYVRTGIGQIFKGKKD